MLLGTPGKQQRPVILGCCLGKIITMHIRYHTINITQSGRIFAASSLTAIATIIAPPSRAINWVSQKAVAGPLPLPRVLLRTRWLWSREVKSPVPPTVHQPEFISRCRIGIRVKAGKEFHVRPELGGAGLEDVQRASERCVA